GLGDDVLEDVREVAGRLQSLHRDLLSRKTTGAAAGALEAVAAQVEQVHAPERLRALVVPEVLRILARQDGMDRAFAVGRGLVLRDAVAELVTTRGGGVPAQQGEQLGARRLRGGLVVVLALTLQRGESGLVHVRAAGER